MIDREEASVKFDGSDVIESGDTVNKGGSSVTFDEVDVIVNGEEMVVGGAVLPHVGGQSVGISCKPVAAWYTDWQVAVGAIATEAILPAFIDVNGAPVGVIFERTVSSGGKAENKWIRLLETLLLRDMRKLRK